MYSLRMSSGTRDAQRRRTRKAIVEAAMRLLGDGGTPSVADVAKAADVSRRTVYLYFPSYEQLLIDATLGLLGSAAVEPPEGEDAETRLERTVRAVQRNAVETEPLGRRLIRLTAEAGERSADGPVRGYRRVEWLEDALEPVRVELGEARFERLVSALTLTIGWEALLVLRDVRGLDPGEAEDVSAWAARALLRAAREDG
jgi:AcrR family transcriptional regulator